MVERTVVGQPHDPYVICLIMISIITLQEPILAQLVERRTVIGQTNDLGCSFKSGRSDFVVF